MKKRVLSALVCSLMMVTTVLPVTQVKATPTTDVEDARSQYEALKNKIQEVNEKIQSLDSDISSVTTQISDNEKQIENIKSEIESTKTEIEKAKQRISDQEDVLGGRLREIYKSGAETNYLAIIFSSTSIGDLISKLDSAQRVVDIDKNVINELNSEKSKLDETVASLDAKNQEIIDKNNEIQKQKEDLEGKKKEQQKVKDSIQAETEEFDKKYLATAEREVVQGLISICKNESSSLSELNSAISQLRNIRDNQLKSPTVIEEVNDAIEQAKVYRDQKQAAADAAAAQSANNNSSHSSSASRGDSGTVSGSVQAVINLAYAQLGKPYVYGAAGPNAFDCSGLTSYCYSNAAGIGIGRDTYSQINAGVEVSQSELRPGDLVFPHSGHVGIYVGNGLMIHAPQSGDVVKVAPVYKFWRARRIIQ